MTGEKNVAENESTSHLENNNKNLLRYTRHRDQKKK